MSVVAKKLSLVFVATALVFAGCTKKPKRPDPSATMLGQSQGAGGLNPSDISTSMGDLTEANSLLEARPEGYYEDENMIKGLLEPVYFDFDQAGIKASERPKLQAAQDYLSKNPQHRLLLEGHCDWRGTAEYNLGLGDRRAAAVKRYLESLGADTGRLETLSKGSTDAKQSGGEAEWAKDRRVDFVELKK